MRVHVTGGSGFLGGHVIPLLRARGHDVTALVRSAGAADAVRQLGAEPVEGDLDDDTSVRKAFTLADADALANLASLGFGHAPTIVRAAETVGLRRAVFVSTTAVFTKLAASSKTVRLAAEETIRRSELDWTILRPTMIYGTPGDRNMARLLQALRRSPVLPLPAAGRGLQQPVHVDDLATAVVSALETPVAVGRIYDVAGPEPLTFREVVTEAAKAVGKRPYLVPVPHATAVAAARIYARVASRPRLSVEQVERLGEDKAFDITAAREDLGYAPRSFRQGIAEEARLL